MGLEVLTGFTWLRIRFVVGPCEYGNQSFCSINGEEFRE
jgi:hypothetical protein